MKLQILILVFGAAMGGPVVAAAAGNNPSEWTLLGPAVTYHERNDGGAIAPPSLMMKCPSSAGNTLVPADALPTNFAGCITDFSTPITRTWNPLNTGFGIQYKSAIRETSEFASIVKDSYGAWGLMGGILYQPVQHQAVGLKFGLGAAAGLWWRTNGQDKLTLSSQPAWRCYRDGGTTCYFERYMFWSTELHRETVPFIIPTLSVKGEHWGANLSVIPKLQIGGSQVVPTNTWILQFTYAL